MEKKQTNNEVEENNLLNKLDDIENTPQHESLFDLLPREIVMEVYQWLAFDDLFIVKDVSSRLRNILFVYINSFNPHQKMGFLADAKITHKTMPYVKCLANLGFNDAKYVLGCYYFYKDLMYISWSYFNDYFNNGGLPYLWTDMALAFAGAVSIKLLETPKEIIIRSRCINDVAKYGEIYDEMLETPLADIEEIYIIFYIHTYRCYHLRAVVFEKTATYDIYLSSEDIKQIYEAATTKFLGHRNTLGCNFVKSSDNCSSLRFNKAYEHSIDLPNWNAKDYLPNNSHRFHLAWMEEDQQKNYQNCAQNCTHNDCTHNDCTQNHTSDEDTQYILSRGLT